MEFEYDPVKSESNLAKHGIDFEEAQEIWSDPFYLEYAVESKGEQRFIAVGRLIDGYWSAVCTMREDRTRIISVRRATMEEVSHYDRKAND